MRGDHLKKISLEKELQEHVVENFDNYFEGLSFKGEEVSVSVHVKQKIDILAEDENNYYLIELKKNFADKYTVSQLERYIREFKRVQERGHKFSRDKGVVGIACAPEINPHCTHIDTPDYIYFKRIDDVKYVPSENVKITKNVMMTIDDKTMKKIERFYFEHNCRSRSEAARKLIRLGLENTKD